MTRTDLKRERRHNAKHERTRRARRNRGAEYRANLFNALDDARCYRMSVHDDLSWLHGPSLNSAAYAMRLAYAAGFRLP